MSDFLEPWGDYKGAGEYFRQMTDTFTLGCEDGIHHIKGYQTIHFINVHLLYVVYTSKAV